VDPHGRGHAPLGREKQEQLGPNHEVFLSGGFRLCAGDCTGIGPPMSRAAVFSAKEPSDRSDGSDGSDEAG